MTAITVGYVAFSLLTEIRFTITSPYHFLLFTWPQWIFPLSVVWHMRASLCTIGIGLNMEFEERISFASSKFRRFNLLLRYAFTFSARYIFILQMFLSGNIRHPTRASKWVNSKLPRYGRMRVTWSYSTERKIRERYTVQHLREFLCFRSRLHMVCTWLLY